MNKHNVLREIAALEATLPAPGPSSHLPVVNGPEDLARVMRQRGAFLIHRDYSLSAKARKSLADIEALSG